jgi:hypothetical protein
VNFNSPSLISSSVACERGHCERIKNPPYPDEAQRVDCEAHRRITVRWLAFSEAGDEVCGTCVA